LTRILAQYARIDIPLLAWPETKRRHVASRFLIRFAEIAMNTSVGQTEASSPCKPSI
jgi:hypothetical protein